MKKIILGFVTLLSLSAHADQSGTYICRNINIFDGGTSAGTWKVEVSADLMFASFVFTSDFHVDHTKIVFPAAPIIRLPRVGTGWGHLRFQDVVTYDGITSTFSFNLMGIENYPRDTLRSKDAVLTQIQDGEKSAHLCVKI